MDHPDFQKTQGDAPCTQKLPPYDVSDQQQPPVGGPAPTTGFAAYPTPPYQPPYAPYDAVPDQGPIIQPPKLTTLDVSVQPTKEPDHLVYSIFTTACCFLPLGLVALYYSIKTRDANLVGDGTAARERSQRARFFANIALGVGMVFLIVDIALIVLLTIKIKSEEDTNPAFVLPSGSPLLKGL